MTPAEQVDPDATRSPDQMRSPDETRSPDATGSPDETSSGIVRLLASLPVVTAVFFALLLATCTSLMLLRAFHGPLALVIAAVLTLIVVRFLGLGERLVTRQALAVDLLAVLLALSFGGINAKYASQDLIIGRDPGVYSVASQWLVNHTSTDVDTQVSLFGTSTDLQTGSSGIGRRPEPGHVYPQGSHGLPAVLAVVGSLFGPRIMYGANALIGGLALLAVYGFGRRLVGRGGALVAVGLLGASLPQIAFSRDAYTEPISQLLLFGGLALLLQARPGRVLDWGIAGLVVAGGCLTRIDSFLVLPPLLLYVGLKLAVAPAGERRTAARDTTFLLAGASVAAVLGYLDLKLFAAGYLHTLASQFGQIEKLLMLSAVAALLLVVVSWRASLVTRMPQWREITRARLGAAAGALVVLIGLALAVRPLLYTSHGISNPGQMAFLTRLQTLEGDPIEPTRSYAEHSVTWLTWYLGPVAVVLGVLGLALLAARAVRRGDIRLAPFFFAMALTGLVYLVNPSITPDQIWAMRRYVPTVLPGIALAAMVVLVPAMVWLAARSRAAAGAAALVVGLALFVPVLHTTWPLSRVAEGAGQLKEVEIVCDALPNDAAVLVLGSLANRYPMTLRTFCGVPSTYSASTTVQTPKELGEIAKTLASHRRQLYVIGQGDIPATVPTKVKPVVLNRIAVSIWERTLSRPPRILRPIGRDMFLGKVGLDGRVSSWLTR